MGTLEHELRKIQDAEIGVAITWLCEGGVDLRLIHKSGVVVAEGNVADVSDVLPWLEGAIKKHFPLYRHAARPLPGNYTSPAIHKPMSRSSEPEPSSSGEVRDQPRSLRAARGFR